MWMVSLYQDTTTEHLPWARHFMYIILLKHSDFVSLLFLSTLLEPPSPPKLEVRETWVKNLASPFIAQAANFPSVSVGPGTP